MPKYEPYQPFEQDDYLQAVGGAQDWSAQQIANLPPPGGQQGRRRGQWQPGQFLQSLMGRFNLQPMGMRKAFGLQGYGNTAQPMWDQRRFGDALAGGGITTSGQANAAPAQTFAMNSGPGATGRPQGQQDRAVWDNLVTGARADLTAAGVNLDGQAASQQVAPTVLNSNRRRPAGKSLRPNMGRTLGRMFSPNKTYSGRM